MGGNLSQEQRETLALIDAIMSMIEKMPKNEMNFGVVINPFEFLLSIISKKVSFDEMVKWLANIITVILPSIELAVKAILIAKLKERIDCNSDPRIPNWIRRDISDRTDSTDFNQKGLIFSLRDIDYTNMLRISPLSKLGSVTYFGVKSYYVIDNNGDEVGKYYTYDEAVAACRENGFEIKSIIDKSEINNVYELARAKDFNAFLWFVVNKGYFPIITELKEYKFLGKDDISFNANDKDGKIFCGECVEKEKSFFSLCIKTEKEKSEYNISDDDALILDNSKEIINHNNPSLKMLSTIVPVSHDNMSANWYVNNGTYFDFLKPIEERSPRDYTKEFAICNLRYMERVNGLNEYGGNYTVYDALRFTILPKPLVHVPMKGEPAWRFKKILFNSEGNPDKKGKYSVKIDDRNRIPSEQGDDYVYQCINGYKVTVNKNTGKYELIGSKDTLYKVLYECYPGLTVYEFNYDFVMSMQLFDSVTIASRLISLITDLRYGANVGANLNISKTETAYQMRISEIVKNIVESTAYEVSDCFYSFDNDKYDAMLRESELKRSHLYPFNKNGKSDGDSENDANKAFDILNEFNDKGNLNENVEVITRAFTQATASITEEVLPEDKYDIQFNIINDIIKSLVNIIVETLITPKVILLFEVNIALLGKRNETNFIKSIDDFLASIGDLLVAIVKEIRDLILKQILDWAISILSDLLNILKDALLKEQLEYYARLMKLLFKACSFRGRHRKPLDTKLDNVDYADIDIVDRPQETNC